MSAPSTTFVSALSRWTTRVHAVQVAGMVGMVNILLHTVVLYILLSARMVPVLALRDAVGLLAKAGSGLTVRADVLSRDEFGQLARDINLFVDRVAQITEDILRILTSFQDLNDRLNRIHADLDGKTVKLHDKVDNAVKLILKEGEQLGIMSREWEQTVDAISALLADLSARGGLTEDTRDRFGQAVAAWREVVNQTRTSGVRRETVTVCLVEVSRDLGEVSHLVSDMAVLEERMTAVAREGETLLKRLRPSAEPTVPDAAS